MPRKRKGKKFDLTFWLIILFIILGVGFLSYPKISDFIVNYGVRKQQQSFALYRQELAQKQAEIVQAQRNQAIAEQDAKRALQQAWDELLQSGKLERTGNVFGGRKSMITLGNVVIPAIGVNMTIHDGTDRDVLDVGAGLLESSDLPFGGRGRHTILTAHSGLPNVRYFTDLEKLQVGDLVFVENFKEVLAYRMVGERKVAPHDVEDLKRHAGKDLLTLVTCTPIGVNSHRYLAFCERTEFTPKVRQIYQAKIQADNDTVEKTDWLIQNGWIFLIILICVVCLICFVILYRRHKNQEKRRTPD